MKVFDNYKDNVHTLEKNVRSQWNERKVYQTQEISGQEKEYILGMFPYPSGNAHLGHVLVYSLSDLQARYARFQGKNVLHPIGWDSFGLPAENAALKHQVHPMQWTEKNIETMKTDQIGSLGFSFDWDREINTSSEEFYRWTQELFLKLDEHGLVYRADEWVNWDPVDQTVLANEQVIDGKGWRSGSPIQRKRMTQWYIRITDYAEELWNGLDELPQWSQAAISAQRNWIGRREGLEITIDALNESAEIISIPGIFMQHSENILGTMAVLISPEYTGLDKHLLPNRLKALKEFRSQVLSKSDLERIASKEKNGLNTGLSAINPITGKQMPLWVADYILTSEGDDFAFCVPGHSENDARFAATYGFSSITVKSNPNLSAEKNRFYDEDEGIMVTDGYEGLSILEARSLIDDKLKAQNRSTQRIKYRLHDWSISRQRFWGCPIPKMTDSKGLWHSVPRSELPVSLPKENLFHQPDTVVTLNSSNSFKHFTDPTTQEPFIREVDTMDTFMCSSWYVWRFLDPRNNTEMFSSEKANSWMPIDRYVGGLEHANQHLIYLRFISRFLHDIGMNPEKEPVKQFQANGMVKLHGSKMSKSKGNVVRPDEIVKRYSADALRMHILSAGPYDRDFDWDEEGVANKHNFLSQIFLFYKKNSSQIPKGVIELCVGDLDDWGRELLKELNETNQLVHNYINKSAFHNVIARTHSLANTLRISEKTINGNPMRQRVLGYCMQAFLKNLSLTAPHLSDYLWQHTFDIDQSLYTQAWSTVSPELLSKTSQDSLEIPILVDGRKRTTMSVNDSEHSDLDLRKLIQDDTQLLASLISNNQEILSTYIVRDTKSQQPKMINLVTKPLGAKTAGALQ